uniref:RAB11 family interacting protein 1 (class I) a n=1 Tax=Oreochromis aureus TaxID=47969 RepID=A0A668TJL2_OREAU
MSLTDQQWCPTSVQVTVLQARSLRIKGKSGTNDAYAVIQVGKEKYQTSVVEKCVAPVWKEEASFDLPQLNQGGGGGGTLHVHVLHRALVGPDKLLGQAVINLSQLSEDKTRNKTEWFKLLDKTGKPDKDRGEVLLDIQFMRNNMTASMFDLSAAGKSRSRLGKFKDKVRGKKKESDSVTSVAPSFSQVLTDSEEEGNGDSEAAAGKDGKHKKHKIKSLFSPKSNLQKSMSQSMSVLPGKNSTLTGSQSSGLNVDSSEGKKKFKFMIHKRSGSSGGKDSSSGREKQVSVEQSNLCINGSHIYCEEPPPRTSRISSNFSLASSGHGSMEDVPENSPPPEQQKAARKCSPWEEDEEEEEEEEEEEDTPEVENVKANVSESKRTIIEEERKEEKVKRQQERLESLAEDREKQEEEETRSKEEEKNRREEEKRRQEQEERVRMEEERERLAEEKRLQDLERRKMEEEEKKKRDEEERIRIEQEKKRLEEVERVKMEARRQEEQKLAEEKRLEEEKRAQEERRRQEEEAKIAEEEERIRKENEEKEEERRRREEEEELLRKLEEEREKKRIQLEQERKQREEEERVRKQEEKKRKEEEEQAKRERKEHERLEEERKLREERKRIEAEEKIRRQERIRMEEEEKRLKEQENQRAEEERLRKEEEKRQEDEERARKQREEYERLLEEKMQQEEQRRLEEEERIRREEEKRVRMEEEMKRRKEVEEERARKEKEEMERLEEERRLQEQEKRRIEEEERIRREKKEEETRKLEKLSNAEEQEKRENTTKDEVRAAGKKPKESSPAVTSTNPFDETFSSNPFEEIPESPDSSTAEEPTVQQRCHSAVSSVRSETSSVDEKDLISTQREKRPAPQPPVRSQAGKQPHREQDVPARHLAQINKQSKDKDVKTVSVSPQRSVQMIAPLCRSPTDSQNSQSLMQSNNANGTTNAAKHSKRPAPSVPPPVGEKQSSEPKTSSNLGGAETKQVKVVCGLNPFEDDEDESELTAQDDRDTAVSSNTGSIHWPPAVSQTADKDAASQPKIKSSKTAHAPLPPAKNDISSNTLTDPGTERSHATGDRSAAAPDNGALQACDPYYESTSPGHVPVSPLQESQSLKVQNIVEAGMKKDGAPTPSRRLQPVRPLNPLEQQGASVVQGENENKSPGIPSGLQDKTTVDDSGMKGPYSQLTRQELISLILKQENQLSERDDKISELEQYIDNLLVRVIEEKPSILMSLTAMKKAA